VRAGDVLKIGFLAMQREVALVDLAGWRSGLQNSARAGGRFVFLMRMPRFFIGTTLLLL
jgi:hypothetical protein